jgi:hypothetical protein
MKQKRKERHKVNFDDMTEEEYDVFVLLKSKSRMEIDEILGELERRLSK